jgi:AraC-like DNA-binding protein
MFLSRVPKAPLSSFVDSVWLAHGPTGPHTRERKLPTGTPTLVINLLEDEIRVYDREDSGRVQRCRGAAVAGPSSELFVIDTAEQAHCAGISFKPGGAFPFFGLPVSEMQDVHVPLEDLWGTRGAVELRDRLLEAPAPEAQLDILEEALLAAARRGLEIHPAVRFAVGEFLQVPQARTMGEVAAQIGLSSRRFIEVFREQVGLTPKRFCRVRRFHEVLRLAFAGGPVDWTDIALSCGYFDQAHFIRDFRAFSGLNPTAYLSHPRRYLTHLPILD